MYLQNCAIPSANGVCFQVRECRISSATSLLFLGFLGSENYILYISWTIFCDFYILFLSIFPLKRSYQLGHVIVPIPFGISVICLMTYNHFPLIY